MSGRLLSQISPLDISIHPFSNFLVWLVIFKVLDFLVRELNPVRHELLHLWKTFLACWFFLGETLLCLRFVPLLFLDYMPCGICSVPCLVRCTSQIIYVFPFMLYLLDYCELLLLSLVGPAVCSCRQIIQIYMCKLIGGDEFFITGVYFYELFLALAICPTIIGGSIYLRCIVLLLNDFWTSGCLSLHCFPCDYL